MHIYLFNCTGFKKGASHQHFTYPEWVHINYNMMTSDISISIKDFGPHTKWPNKIDSNLNYLGYVLITSDKTMCR